MISRSKQSWEIGQLVKVGFISNLEVLAKIPTPGDYRPDQYLLRANTKGETRFYTFTPHCGIERISTSEAQNLL